MHAFCNAMAQDLKRIAWIKRKTFVELYVKSKENSSTLNSEFVQF